MEEAIKYKNVIREYFLEYKNRDQVLRSIFYVILFGASFSPFVFGSAKEGLGYIWLTFPMALALFAAITHTSALPTMLYLVPGSKKLREEYIRRMLKVKIGLPLALCAVIDIILLIVQPMMIKGVILQLVTVFFMSYCVGITNDGLVWRNNASRAAYGQVSYFNGPITVFSVIASCVMIGICSSEITNVEFWVALVIYLIITHLFLIRFTSVGVESERNSPSMNLQRRRRHGTGNRH